MDENRQPDASCGNGVPPTAGGHGAKWPRRFEPAIAALLTEPTVAAAAAAARVSVRTLTGWLARPDFVAQYRAARTALVEGTLGRLAALGDQAHDALQRNLNCGKPAAEIRAAAVVIDRALAGVEMSDVLSRLDRLEETMAGRASP